MNEKYEVIKNIEHELNEKYKEQNQFITLMDVYDELGIDTSWYRFLISQNRFPDYAWNKEVFGFIQAKNNFTPNESSKSSYL